MFSTMSSDPNLMMLGRGGMMQTGNQPNAPMMMNQNMGPMGNRFQPRMMGPQNMMGAGMGGPMANNNMMQGGGGQPQMMFGGQQQPMMQQRQMNQQQQWGGGYGGSGGMGPQQSMGYPAPPYGAPHQQNIQMGQAGSMGPRFNVSSQSMNAGVVGGVSGNQVMNAPSASQPGTKQALQNLLRTRHSGPNQYLGNNPVGGNPVGASSGNINMQSNVGSGGQVPPFALPRQNYQVPML
jgi:hypothetical protein